MGRPIFWFTVKPLQDELEGTDRWAFANNWVSITPLRLDLTAEKDLTRALSLPRTPPVDVKKRPKPKPRGRRKTRKRRLGVE
jgi:5'-nucleotidase